MSGASVIIRNQVTAAVAAALDLVYHRNGLVIPVTKFGRNVGVPNATFDPINPTGTLNFLQVADTMQIAAGGDANDTAAGSGAREVTIEGIAVVDGNLRFSTEAIATAGASASAATSLSWWRVFRAMVTAVGTYGGANTAAIEIENTNTPVERLTIALGVGQSQNAAYATPDDKQFIIEHVMMSVDANQSAEVQLIVREGFTTIVAPMNPAIKKRTFEAGVGHTHIDMASPLVVPPLSDVWMIGSAGASTASVSATFSGKLVPNG